MRARPEINQISIKEANYPSLLKEITDPPETIYKIGALPPDEQPKIAVVGTRKATPEGKLIAKKIAKELADNGIVVVSGLAMGIDTAAHEGAVADGGKTIAVLGSGPDKIYPAQNENLARKILDLSGAIISEYPPGTPSFPNQFLERNRIISGLCLATVVVEAPERSGSLVTARLAAEQGREVFVIPGPANHSNYRGSHQLIRDGARLATSTDEILEDLGVASRINANLNTDSANNPNLNAGEKIILEIIKKSKGPVAVDEISELAKLEIRAVNKILTFLAIKGIIKETPKGFTTNS